MKPSLLSLPESLLARLQQLADNRLNLLLMLFALDAFFHPYANLHHDAKLYAIQVLNRVEGGFFDNDLFFAYGSQDRYSLFSLVMAPLVTALGLHLSFFLGYLASKALFFFGAVRLVEALIPDRRASTLALIFVALTTIPYGGVECFHVNESFFTPRLTASALVLLGLERMLAGRFFLAAGLLLLAMGLHPLMTFGGVMVFGFYLAGRWFTARALWMATVVAGILGGIVLLHQGLGVRIFGFMDDDWRELVLRRSPHCFPSEWSVLDWTRIGAAFAMLVLAPKYLTPELARFCRAVGVAGIVGLGSAWIAEDSPYALLIQGQSFRVLWLVQFLGVPLGFFLVFRYGAEQRPVSQLVALLLLYGLCSNFNVAGQATWLLAGIFPIFAILSRGLAVQPRNSQWIGISAVASIGIVFLLTLLLHVRSVIVEWSLLIGNFEPLLLLWGIPGAYDRPALFLLVLLLVALMVKQFGTQARLRYLLLAAWLGGQGLFFGLNQWEGYCKEYQKDYANMMFVRDFLQQESNRQVTVYWPTDLNFLWFDLHANSYFNLMQTPGNIFNRKTAVVGDRRADLVYKFDLNHLQTLPITNRNWHLAARNYPALPIEPEPEPQEFYPGRADLERLCADEILDYVVTLAPLGNDYCATNGKVYIYDCRQVRKFSREPRARADSALARGSRLNEMRSTWCGPCPYRSPNFSASSARPTTPRIGGAASKGRSCGSWRKSANCRRRCGAATSASERKNSPTYWPGWRRWPISRRSIWKPRSRPSMAEDVPDADGLLVNAVKQKNPDRRGTTLRSSVASED